MKKPERNRKLDVNTATRKPRILIAGEFSAGKTKLVNGLVADAILPSNVTSTALPPVWITQGQEAKAVVDLNEQVNQCDSFNGVSVSETLYCMLGTGSEFVTAVELIDTPGNSDPNIPSECWERMLGYADMVVWCTNATQAWRQSEKAVWDDMPEHLRKNATLLVTHADRLPDTRSRDRVLRRLARETGDYFEHLILASLLDVDDLAKVGSHILGVAANLEALPGVENDIVKAFVAAERKHRKPADADIIKPRRVLSKQRKNANTESVDASELKQDSETPAETAPGSDILAKSKPNENLSLPSVPADPEADPLDGKIQSATIYPLVSGGAAAQDAPVVDQSAIRPHSEARAFWIEISEGVDMTDADALLSCVERLIAKLDNEPKPLENVTDDAADFGSGDEQIRNIVSRS